MKDIELNMFITLLRQLVRELRIMQYIDIIMKKLYCAAGDFLGVYSHSLDILTLLQCQILCKK